MYVLPDAGGEVTRMRRFGITEIFIKDKKMLEAGSQKSEVFKKYIVSLRCQNFLNFHFSLKITIFATSKFRNELIRRNIKT